jgi:outer membrane protein assembly factor BamB
VAKFTTENEVLASPVFVGNLVVAGSTDNCLYGYSMENRRLEFVEELSDDILVDLCALEAGVVAATVDGKVHCFDAARRKVAWSRDLKVQATCVSASPLGLHLGTSDGSIVTLDPKTGERSWSLSLGSGSVSGMCLGPRNAYLCLDSGKTAAVDTAERRIAWEYQSEKPILIPPIIVGKYLHVGSALGKIELIEVIE